MTVYCHRSAHSAHLSLRLVEVIVQVLQGLLRVVQMCILLGGVKFSSLSDYGLHLLHVQPVVTNTLRVKSDSNSFQPEAKTQLYFLKIDHISTDNLINCSSG